MNSMCSILFHHLCKMHLQIVWSKKKTPKNIEKKYTSTKHAVRVLILNKLLSHLIGVCCGGNVILIIIMEEFML